MIKAVSPIDIEGIYREYLDSKQEENRKERYEGNEHWYHASGSGSCSRKLYFESVEQIKPTNAFDTKTKRLLRLGSVIHEDIQSSLTRTRTLNGTSSISSSISSKEKENKNKEKEIEFHVEGEVAIDELNVRGFYDVVAKDEKVYLYDIKTCSGWAWQMKFGRKKQVNPSIHYELQLGTYG